MAIVVSAGQKQPGFSYYLVGALCRNVAAVLVSKLQPASSTEDPAYSQAVEIMSSGEAGPDMLEWAERYLCGMAGADAEQFLAGRKRQE